VHPFFETSRAAVIKSETREFDEQGIVIALDRLPDRCSFLA
jgi:hypothetical protein